MNSIKFIITNTQYFKLTPEALTEDSDLEWMSCEIDYIDEEKNINLKFGYTDIYQFYGHFFKKDFVDNLINNKNFFDKTITPEIGIAWNEFMEGWIKDPDIDKYYFTGTRQPQAYDSWFYNDEKGNIIFEVTPFYPWHYQTNTYTPCKDGTLEFNNTPLPLQRKLKKTHPNFVTYEEFIKNYKSILKIIIPKERLIEWNEQAKLYKSPYTNIPEIYESN